MTRIRRRSLLAGALALPALLRTGPLQAQGAADSAREAAGEIDDPHIERFELGLGEGPPWAIQLARPATPPPATGYPLLTLLDGNGMVPLALQARKAANAAQMTSQAAHAAQVTSQAANTAGVALLAIDQPAGPRQDPDRRFFDLTPPTAAESFGPRRDNPPPSGGRERLLDFLETVLRPAVAARLPLDPARQTLFGHSLGGLFGLHVLFTRPHLFNAYALADPSIWWNRRSVLDEQAAFLGGLRAGGGQLARPLDLLLSVAGVSRPGPYRSAIGNGPGGLETARALAALPGMRVGFRRMEGEDHGSMVPQAVADALVLATGRMPEGSAPP